MKLKKLLVGKIITGMPVTFKKIKLNDGSRVMSLITENGDQYIIEGSLDNYLRFKKWEGKKSIADIQKTKRKIETENDGKIRVVKIRTTVSINTEQKQKKYNDYEDLEK